MLIDVLLLLFGGAMLYYGAEWLVSGSAGLARAYGVSAFVVGATVVAYGTSAPELVVGIAATLEDRGAIALGNAIGSNIANIGLILGVTALIKPPNVSGTIIRREAPLLLAVTAALVPMLLDGRVGRPEGGVLVAGAIGFTVWMLRAKPEGLVDVDDDEGKPQSKRRMVLLSLLGLAVLVGGGKGFVEGASGLALALGMSERTVGLTIVAIGTSLPELAASLVAAFRGHSDLAIGNVIGSNIFNILLIIGATALVRPLSSTASELQFDIIVVSAITVLCVFFFRGARSMKRFEGVILLGCYASFLVALAVK